MIPKTISIYIFFLLCFTTVINAGVLPPDSVPAPAATLADFTFAANASRPAVVHIKTYSRYTQEQMNLGPLEDFFREFYGDQYNSKPKEQQPKEEPELSGAGSGVIISANGLIITNNHITENAERIEVVLNDKRSFNAKIIGKDPTTDVALIKIETTGLQTIEYGDSDALKVGEWVLAVGNPFNLTSTVTAGIISAKGRNINILGTNNNMAIESFIQTDAAVNPGNSGGALVNLQGQLIGINTAIASPTGAFTGYSFAVPVNIVKKVISDLQKYGQVQRGLLGVMIRDLDAELAKEKKIENLAGVYVEDVNVGSSAEEAGLKKGDVILAINGIVVNSPSELQEIVALKRPGDVVKILYRRNNKEKEINATLKNKEGKTSMIHFDPEAVENRIGANLYEATIAELKRLRIAGGAKVVEIQPGRFMDAGVKEGFIITHVGKQKIKDVKDARALLESIKNKDIRLEGVYPNGEKAIYDVTGLSGN
jgi:Do/DeqQ family serine protease